MITVSVPGKVHLMGEHAVVYGRPALISTINMRMRVSIEPNTQNAEAISIVSTEPTEHAHYAVAWLLEKLQIHDPKKITITIDSDIPAGYHIGSSAAMAAALSGAVLFYFKKIWNPMKINELAYEIEKKQHGNPSGGDNTAVTMGGFIWFRKELEFLRSIWQLPFKPHTSLNHFFLINTGRPRETTGEMVELVKLKVESQKAKMEQLFSLNENQVKRVTTALKEGNENELIDAIRSGEKTLESMGVVSRKVQPLMRKIEASGGAVKILGGGGQQEGVGFLLCYHHEPKTIEEIAREYSYTIQLITLGEEGIRLDEK